MKILGIDTTGNVSSVAIVDEDKTIAEFSTNYKKTHSETLMPMIKLMFDITGLSLSEMNYIACASGPGSFTGLRIGAASAKGLAVGQNKRIIPVPTLDALAYNIFDNENAIIVPLMDARRNQAYTANYLWEHGKLVRLSEYDAISIENIIKILESYDGRKVIFLGDGVPVFKEIIEKSGLNYSFAQAHTNRQRAASVGSYAIFLAGEGAANIVDPEDFIPYYLRQSQAEREYKGDLVMRDAHDLLRS